MPSNLRLGYYTILSSHPQKQHGLQREQAEGWLGLHFLTPRTPGERLQIMSNLHFTTKHANAATVQRQWHVVDGTNQTVGRMCAKIAAMLRGKHKASYTPHVDTGDYIIVINCEKVVFTGNKQEQKIYDTYSGCPGGRKEETAESLMKRRPEVVIERAVKGMLPKNRLGRQMYKKLFVYAGAEHPHKAQQPKELKF